jgi:pimeloyl-ACP methyl ester carboxylesterase
MTFTRRSASATYTNQPVERRGLLRRARRFAFVCAVVAIGLLGAAALAESWLEVQDVKRVAGSETFVDVGGAHVRYRLVGGGQSGPIVVLLNGMSGSVEQWQHVQTSVGTFAVVLAYDRGGSGFSRGSGAHDAQQQADELAGLLAALGLERRIVLVGFSNSASIARVFVGRHRERVAGLVLAAPYLPEIEGRVAGRHGPLRAYARWLLHESVTTLFGLKRFAAMVAGRSGHSARSTIVEQRVTAILLRFGHWWAVDREWLATVATAREVFASDALGDLPLILLSSATTDIGESGRIGDEVTREFAARSSRGSVRSLGRGDHRNVLDDVSSYQAVIDAIHDVTTLTR